MVSIVRRLLVVLGLLHEGRELLLEPLLPLLVGALGRLPLLLLSGALPLLLGQDGLLADGLVDLAQGRGGGARAKQTVATGR